jgi:hypothetical protein
MDNFMLHGVSYQLRFRVCNKPVCRCHEGQKHGPYWYAYSDKLVYIGKVLPDKILVDLAKLKCEQEPIKKKVRSLDVRISALSKELVSLQNLRRDLQLYSAGYGSPSCLRSVDPG